MRVKKAYKDKDNKKSKSYSTSYYTKFKKVSLAASGPIVLCQAITVDGVTENFCWTRKSDRDLVKNNTLPDAEIIVAPNVSADRGWDYCA